MSKYILFICNNCQKAEISELRPSTKNVSGKGLLCRNCYKNTIFNAAKVIKIYDLPNDARAHMRRINVYNEPAILLTDKERLIELGEKYIVNEQRKILREKPENKLSFKESVDKILQQSKGSDGFIDETKLFQELQKAGHLDSKNKTEAERFEYLFTKLNMAGSILLTAGKYKVVE